MGKLLSFFLALNIGVTVYGIDTRPEKPLVTRYPVWLDNLMYKISTHKHLENITRNIRGPLEQVPANQYTQLFQNAQREVGIKESDMLPIKICEVEADTETTLLAKTTVNEILISPINFDALSYGEQRHTAIHEAFHHKYHDQTRKAYIDAFSPIAALIASSLTTAGLWTQIYIKKQNRFRIAKAIAAPFLSLAIGLTAILPIQAFSLYCQDHQEFRADRDALELLKCYKCADDVFRGSLEYDTPAEYMTPSEKQIYCDHYKENNMLCSHHRDKAERIEN